MVTIYWRDIPAQVNVTSQGEKHSWLLSERFQIAIDRAASIAGLTDANDYVLEWRRVRTTYDCDGPGLAKAEAERLEALYPSDRVQSLVTNGGVEPATSSGDTAADPPTESDPT